MERHVKANALLCALLMAGYTGNMGHAHRNQADAETPKGAPIDVSQSKTATQVQVAKQPAAELNGSLDPSGRLALPTGDMSVVINASGCEVFTDAVSECADRVAVSLSRQNGREQVLEPSGLFIDSEATLFRGPLGQRDATKGHSIVIADVNGDGREDISLWTGRRGGYGSDSYDVYLSDPASGRFVHSTPFSELIVGRLGLFQLEGGKLRLNAKSGCCIHSKEWYEVENNIPVLVERIEEDATGGKDPPKQTVWRRIDGAMQEIKD